MAAVYASKNLSDFPLRLINTLTPGEAASLLDSGKVEGLMLKRKDMPYVGQRTKHWIKVKRIHTVSFLFTGYDFEKDAARIALIPEEGGAQWLDFGQVGSGLSAMIRSQIDEHVQKHGYAILDIAFQSWNPESKRLRFPRVCGMRVDLPPQEATTDQLKDCTVSSTIH